MRVSRYVLELTPSQVLFRSARWRDDIYLDTGFGVIRQEAYAVYGVRASDELNDHVELTRTWTTSPMKKYLTSLCWDQAFTAAQPQCEHALEMLIADGSVIAGARKQRQRQES